mgnify:CR=1 FL=1
MRGIFGSVVNCWWEGGWGGSAADRQWDGGAERQRGREAVRQRGRGAEKNDRRAGLRPAATHFLRMPLRGGIPGVALAKARLTPGYSLSRLRRAQEKAHAQARKASLEHATQGPGRVSRSVQSKAHAQARKASLEHATQGMKAMHEDGVQEEGEAAVTMRRRNAGTPAAVQR